MEMAEKEQIFPMHDLVSPSDTDTLKRLQDSCYRNWGMREIAESSSYIPKTMTADDLQGMADCIQSGKESKSFKADVEEQNEWQVLRQVQQAIFNSALNGGGTTLKFDFSQLKLKMPNAAERALEYLANKNLPRERQGDFVITRVR
jgi:hypothetical protein